MTVVKCVRLIVRYKSIVYMLCARCCTQWHKATCYSLRHTNDIGLMAYAINSKEFTSAPEACHYLISNGYALHLLAKGNHYIEHSRLVHYHASRTLHQWLEQECTYIITVQRFF